jgi:glycosyltransferase involved in cell wall biosynthesis
VAAITKGLAGNVKILILSGGSLFPVRGMSQVRTLNQILYLAQFFTVDYAEFSNAPENILLANKGLPENLNAYFPIYAEQFGKSKLTKLLTRISRRIRFALLDTTFEELRAGSKGILKQLQALHEQNHYDCVIVHYWYQATIFPFLRGNVIKMIDTHYAVEENIEIQKKGQYTHRNAKRLDKELQHSLKMQYKYFDLSDAIIVNSAKQEILIHQKRPDLPVLTIPNGQDLDSFTSFQAELDTNAILFYGALSNQFNGKALKRLLERIFPQLLIHNPNLKLYIVGANPPEYLNEYKSDNIIITGFVDDIRPIVAKCMYLMLPLETASGFRGRCIEVMALGVPVIGTSNALQSIDMENGVHGFIAETDEELIADAIKLSSDLDLRNKMANAAKQLVMHNYTLDATFGILKNYLQK